MSRVSRDGASMRSSKEEPLPATRHEMIRVRSWAKVGRGLGSRVGRCATRTKVKIAEVREK